MLWPAITYFYNSWRNASYANHLLLAPYTQPLIDIINKRSPMA
jgi:hypothetical protein